MKLQEKGWQGDVSCQFCSAQEDNDHLFFQCHFARTIWFYMGRCQHFRHHWHTMEDLIQFALTLDKPNRYAFLIVASAVIWCIWKQRNDLCFHHSIVYSCRKVILTIVSIAIYWTGQLKAELQDRVNEWLPQDLDEVPTQIVHNGDANVLAWTLTDFRSQTL